MGASRYITTAEAALLTGEGDNRVREKIAKGAYRAVEIKKVRGGDRGKSYLIGIESLPLQAQLKYIMLNEGCRLEGADIVSYKERYGERGLKELIDRRNAVFEALAIEGDGKGSIAQRKEAVAAKYDVNPRTLYRWCKQYAQDGTAGLMDKLSQRNKGQPKSLCLCAQDVSLCCSLRSNAPTVRYTTG